MSVKVTGGGGGGGTGQASTYAHSLLTTQFDKTSSTTLGNTGLSVAVSAGQRYTFVIEVFSSIGPGGAKFSIGGTATATASIVDFIDYDIADQSVLSGRVASIGTAFVTGVPIIGTGTFHTTITGYLLVNAAGTLTLQFAQNSSDLTTCSILVGSSLTLDHF